jgi:hypothetical protein
MLGRDNDSADEVYDLGLRLLRQVGSLSEVADRTRAIADSYLRYTTDPAHCEKALAMREEARRLLRIIGQWEPLLNPARDEILRILCDDRQRHPDFPQCQISFDGPCRGWWMVTPETLASCQKSVDSCFGVLGGRNSIGQLEIEFYDALHFVLSPIRSDGPAHRTQWFERIRSARQPGPSSEEREMLQIVHAIDAAHVGALPLNNELTKEYGPYAFLAVESCSIVAQVLRHVVLGQWQAFARSFAPRLMDEHGVYPGGWEEWGKGGWEHIEKKTRELAAFYARAADARAGVICGPSGVALEQIRAEWQRQQPEPRYDWFEGKAGLSWGEIDGTCRRCGYGFSFEAARGEKPLPQCPMCGNR